jgi:hypothetical protein
MAVRAFMRVLYRAGSQLISPFPNLTVTLHAGAWSKKVQLVLPLICEGNG